MPKVTIALITFNRPEYLKLAMQGALSQTFHDFELLIMDNGSDESTRKTVSEFDDPRIVLYSNQENTRDFVNKAFLLAKSDFLLITHDDDIMMPDMLRRQVEVMEKEKKVIMVACNMTDIDPKGNILKNVTHNLKKDLCFEKEEFISFYLTRGISLTCPTVLMRMNEIRLHNLKFDLTVGPATDVYLWFIANLLPYKIYFISEPLYFYRIHDSQDSTLNKLSMEITLYKSLKAFLVNHDLDRYVILLKKLKMNTIFGILTNFYVQNKISKAEFNAFISSLKKDGLNPAISKKSMLRFGFFKLSPLLYKKISVCYAKAMH
jgi:glycosyltransferase involved in cell wall biosynthesis